ncbi:MAG: serine/threonine protein kinase [Myxococcales bacterium]|nr:serine/threonine protein kinase [Myxococcales bacterium]MCB9651201.1 serine/threonine protein kinase [Deltaproteobacteria bacterium]
MREAGANTISEDEGNANAGAAAWRRANALFLELASRPHADQAAYLAALREPSDVMEALRDLLALTTGPLSDLEQVLLRPDVGAPGEGHRLGPYVLETVVGRGGAGEVWRAFRDDGVYRGRVAIKVLRSGLDSAEALARIRRERQILADLRHPNIAALLDGGTTERGLPFIAMEYIEGQRLDRYCKEGCLSIPERLRLFLELCAAVAFAHGSAVIHRDIKPANILVDVAGRLKLLDFGIAKLLAPSDDSTLTHHGRQPLTPQYASPEQLAGAPAGPASDVYSLGLVLYELICGRRPYEVDPTAGEAAVRAVVCDVIPPLPSRVSVLPVAERRLRRDLDQVVLRALRKPPEARYATAEALADDVRRAMEGRPVRARGSGLGYRVAHQVIRHRRALAVVGAAGIVAGALAMQVELQSRSLVRERAHSARVKSLTLSLLRTLRNELRGEERAAALVFLDGASEDLAALSPDLEERLLMAEMLVSAYAEIGAVTKAAALSERVALLRAQSHGVDELEVLRGRERLAHLRASAGRGEEALLELEALLVEKTRTFGPESQERAETLNGLGAVLWDLGRHDAAVERYRESLAVLRKLHGVAHNDVAAVEGNLGLVLATVGALDEAQGLLSHAVEVSQASLPEGHGQLQAHRMILGDVLRERGELDQALELQSRALAVFLEQGLDPRRDLATADLLVRMARTYSAMGDLDAAEQRAMQALEIDADVRGSPKVEAEGQTELGRAYLTAGRLADAKAVLRSALYTYDASPTASGMRRAECESLLGEALVASGDLGVGQRLLRSAAAEALEQLGPDAPITRAARERLVSSEAREREVPEACLPLASSGWAR